MSSQVMPPDAAGPCLRGRWDRPPACLTARCRARILDQLEYAVGVAPVDEIVTAAKQRGVWMSAPGSIVEHNHPAWGKAPDDDVYRKGQANAQRDQATFRKRVKAHVGG